MLFLSAVPPTGLTRGPVSLLPALILGSVYALIAIGYTLVYGILRMINFAHGDIMMVGAFGGYFVFEAFKAIPAPTLADPKMTFLDANPFLSVVARFYRRCFRSRPGRLFS